MDTSHHCTSCVYSPIICVVELIVGSLILWLENFPLDFQYCIEHLIHKCICQARWRDHSLQHQSIVIWITSICVILDVLWYIHTDTLWYVIIGPQKSDTRRTWTRISTGKNSNPDSCWAQLWARACLSALQLDYSSSGFLQGLVSIKEKIREIEGPDMKENMQDQIRQWFIECRYIWPLIVNDIPFQLLEQNWG